ncbi:MAG: histidine kinase [Mycetocola sp.]
MNRVGTAAIAGVITIAVAAAVFAYRLLDQDLSRSLASTTPFSTLALIGAATALLVAAGTAAVPPAVTAVPVLLSGIAVAWVAPVLEGWLDGPDLVRSAAGAIAPLIVPAALHLALLDGSGRLTPARRWGPVAIWSTFAVGSALVAAVRDPFLDLTCWSNCTANSFLIVPAPELARALTAGLAWVSGGACALAAAWLALTVARSAPTGLDLVTRVVPTAALLVVLSSSSFARAILWTTPITASPFPELQVAGSLALIAVAVGWIAWISNRRTRRAAVLRLIDDLATHSPSEQPLEARLGTSLKDPELRVLYALPGETGWFDASGVERAFVTDDSRAITEIRRQGELIALVLHDRSLLSERELGARIGAAARLAIDNERLRAGVLAQLAALHDSRVRIVDSADNERRRIERNLHDGAQQSLLVARYDLGLARSKSTDQATVDALDLAIHDLVGITENLRSIAHGIFPAVLADFGLESALHHLAEDSVVPVIVDVRLAERLPATVERLVYLVVRAAVDAATTDGGTITIQVWRTAEGVRVVLRGAPLPTTRQLEDRVGALNGTLTGDASGLEAVIPCA